MILFIDTTDPESAHLVLVLNNKKKFEHKFQVERNLSERLVPEIQKFLEKLRQRRIRPNSVKKSGGKNFLFSGIDKIAVITGPGQFSQIRTAVASANALAYGLGIPVVGVKLADKNNLARILKHPGSQAAKPFYDRGPNITFSKRTL